MGHISIQSNKTEKGKPNLKVYTTGLSVCAVGIPKHLKRQAGRPASQGEAGTKVSGCSHAAPPLDNTALPDEEK